MNTDTALLSLPTFLELPQLTSAEIVIMSAVVNDRKPSPS